MRRFRWYLLGSVVAVAAACVVLNGGRPPVPGSHIEFLRPESAEDSYAYMRMQHGELVRGQMIDIYGAGFDSVNQRVAARVAGLPGFRTQRYVPVELQKLRVLRGVHYWAPRGTEAPGISVEEKALGGKRFVEVCEFQAVGLRDSLVARAASLGQDLERVHTIKRDDAQLVAGDPQAELRS